MTDAMTKYNEWLTTVQPKFMFNETYEKNAWHLAFDDGSWIMLGDKGDYLVITGTEEYCGNNLGFACKFLWNGHARFNYGAEFIDP